LERLQEQAQSQTEYPLSERDERQLARRKVRTLTGEVEVEVPEKGANSGRGKVFSLLDHGPLYEKCTFLSYDSVQSIAREKFLSHMSDTILDEYEEHAEEG
jgi:hypothetical protein